MLKLLDKKIIYNLTVKKFPYPYVLWNVQQLHVAELDDLCVISMTTMILNDYWLVSV